MKEKGNATIAILLFVIAILLAVIIGGVSYYADLKKGNIWPPAPEPSQVACTMEALLCPDGSAVGRVGPNCEFAPCPTPVTPTTFD